MDGPGAPVAAQARSSGQCLLADVRSVMMDGMVSEDDRAASPAEWVVIAS